MTIEYWEEDLQVLCQKLETNLERGLSTTVAKKRLAEDGKNKFTMPARPVSGFFQFLRSCFYSFGYIIFVCIFCCLILNDGNFEANNENINVEYILDVIIILGIFLLTGYLRYVQANDDYGVALVFKELMPLYCTVFRDGKKQIILAEHLVLGDILDITYGERIAADVRVFIANDLEFNNVALFGLSIPVTIDPDLTHKDKSTACNVALACSHVIKGNGKGIVIGCGDQSEVGIMAKLSTQKRPPSRVQKHYRQLSGIALIAAVLIAIIVFYTYLLEDSALLLEFNINFVITLLPLNLPILIFFGLWHTGNKLLARGCYVRNMEAASTLGLTTVLCSLLVGTLTMRKWRVSDFFVDGKFTQIDFLDVDNPSFLQLVRVSVLCNDASEIPGQRGVPQEKKIMFGRKFDKAVFQFAINTIPQYYHLRQKYKILAKKPYNSIHHTEVMVVKSISEDVDQEFVLIIKGNVDVVIGYCSTESIGNVEVQLNRSRRIYIIAEKTKLHRKGRICFAYARKLLNEQDTKLMSLISKGFKSSKCPNFISFMTTYAHGLSLTGIISASNPPHQNIRYAVDRFRSAGIKLVLLTQTEKYFAQAVAKSVGIIGSYSETVEDVAIRLNIAESQVKRSLITAAVVDMKNFEKKDHHQRWDAKHLLLAHTDLVFAQIAVKQRSMIVDVCQELGAVVSVVGQSVHDTPGIRRASVGVAVSASSKASKYCADVITSEGGLHTLVDSIEESRLLFVNLKKAIVYTLSPKMAMILVNLAYILMDVPFRLYIIVSLIIEIFVNMLPALSLFYEHPEGDLMTQMPCIFDDLLINRRSIYVAYLLVGLVQASAVFIAYFAYMAHNGFLPRSLIGLRTHWYDDSINDIVDSFGQEWTWDARAQLNYRISTVTIITFVVMQSINLILTKTGRANLLLHGFGNMRLNFAVIYLICFGGIVSFLDSPDVLRILSIKFIPLLLFLWPLMLLNVVMECARRYIIRRFPGGWLEEETHFC